MRRLREDRGAAEYGSLPFSVLPAKKDVHANQQPDFGLYEMHLLYIRTAQLSLSNRTEPASSKLSV